MAKKKTEYQTPPRDPPTDAEVEGLKVRAFYEETLVGDLVQWVRDELVAAEKPWQSMSEAAQFQVIERLRHRAEYVAAQLLDVLSAENMPALTADLVLVQFKNGIKAQLEFRKDDPNRFLLADAIGDRLRVVILPPMDALGGGIPDPDPDQSSLFGGGNG